MNKRLAVAIFCLLFSTFTFAQDSCGIGTAIKKYNKIDDPSTDDMKVVMLVIINNESMHQPFYFCDDEIDLKPGIKFIDVYIDAVLATGRTIHDPAIVLARKMQKEMKDSIDSDN